MKWPINCVAMAAGALAFGGSAWGQTILTLYPSNDSALCYPVAAGTLFQVMLPATAGTGYGWAVRSADGFEQVGEAMVSAPAGGGMIVGGPQTQTLRFRPTLAGRRRLTLGYARAGERAAPIKTASFCFVVRAG